MHGFPEPMLELIQRYRREARYPGGRNACVKALTNHALNTADWNLLRNLLVGGDKYESETCLREMRFRLRTADMDIEPILDLLLDQYLLEKPDLDARGRAWRTGRSLMNCRRKVNWL